MWGQRNYAAAQVRDPPGANRNGTCDLARANRSPGKSPTYPWKLGETVLRVLDEEVISFPARQRTDKAPASAVEPPAPRTDRRRRTSFSSPACTWTNIATPRAASRRLLAEKAF